MALGFAFGLHVNLAKHGSPLPTGGPSHFCACEACTGQGWVGRHWTLPACYAYPTTDPVVMCCGPTVCVDEGAGERCTAEAPAHWILHQPCGMWHPDAGHRQACAARAELCVWGGLTSLLHHLVQLPEPWGRVGRGRGPEPQDLPGRPLLERDHLQLPVG